MDGAMRRNGRARAWVPWNLAAALVLILIGAGFSVGAQQVNLTCAAAISLKTSLDEISKIYSAKHGGGQVTLSYGGSGTLEQQIEHGAPIDIFFSAAEKEMDELQKQNMLLNDTRRDVLRNKLVVVVPAASKGVRSIEDLSKPEVRKVAVGQFETVPAGMYAKETLQHDGMLDKLQDKLVYAKDVRQVLTYVETGDADAGFVYRTDAMNSKTAHVAFEVPDDAHEPIVYPAAVVKSSEHADAAKGFLQFLSSAEAGAVFEKNGFALAGAEKN
jgi:molybdate transport system substrate-binding protein